MGGGGGAPSFRGGGGGPPHVGAGPSHPSTGGIARGGPRGGGHADSGRHGHHRGHFARGFGYGPWLGYGYYDGYYGADDCSWLRRKALETGSRYWWRRYNDCRY